jgi:hypothetical protein
MDNTERFAKTIFALWRVSNITQNKNQKIGGTGGLTMADYISREAALDFLIPTDDLSISSQDQWALGDRFEKFLESIPAADVRPVVHGGWKPNPRNPYWLDCTVCGYARPDRTVYNFCPNCGADMREVKTNV